MQRFDDQGTLTIEYSLPEALVVSLERASMLLDVEEKDLVIQALQEFFEKHDIRIGDQC